MAVGSPFLRGLDLGRHGLTWCLPDIDCAHPLDSGGAGVLHRSVEETADSLGGVDGRTWRRVFRPLVDGYDALAEDLMQPLTHLPRHPLRLARFGPQALLPTAAMARLWRSGTTRALFAGVAAHAFRPFDRPASAAVGLTIIAAGHRHGWPVASGGSRAISDALASLTVELGGRIETGVRVRSQADLPPADVVLFDLAPRAVADILGDRLPARVARAYRRYRHGPGAFKVDFAVQEGVPWTAEAARRAGTVHVGGSYEEVAGTERAIHAGRMPERPFVLVGQQYLADPLRSKGDVHPVWTYAHVPHGYDGDATEAVVAQIERFAPDSASESWTWPSAHRPPSRSTTRTTSAVTSSPGRTPPSSSCCAPAPHSTPTAPACRACTSAPPRRHRGRRPRHVRRERGRVGAAPTSRIGDKR